jgi:hypothetical protein
MKKVGIFICFRERQVFCVLFWGRRVGFAYYHVDLVDFDFCRVWGLDFVVNGVWGLGARGFATGRLVHDALMIWLIKSLGWWLIVVV